MLLCRLVGLVIQRSGKICLSKNVSKMGQGGDKTFSSLADLTPDPANARKHNPRNVGMLVDALHQVGAARSIVVDEDGVVLAGNATIEAAAEAGIHKVKTVEADGSEIVAVVRRGLSKEQKTKLALYDNRVAELAEWNPEVLSELVDTKAFEGMFSDKELAEILTQTGVEPGIEEGAARLTLSERFLVPPFSVLDARQGYWQDRKRAWIALGIQSELGRGGQSGTSARAKPGERPTYREIKGGGRRQGAARDQQ